MSWVKRWMNWCRGGFSSQQSERSQQSEASCEDQPRSTCETSAAASQSDEARQSSSPNNLVPGSAPATPTPLAQSTPPAAPSLYSSSQVMAAKDRLREMELLLINYAQHSAQATALGTASEQDVCEFREFIDEMTACMCELNALLDRIQASSEQYDKIRR